MRSRHSVRTYQGNLLTRNSSGNGRPQSSHQLAKPLWPNPGVMSGISVRVLISTLKKKKKKKIKKERKVKKKKGKKKRKEKKAHAGNQRTFPKFLAVRKNLPPPRLYLQLDKLLK